MVRAVAGKETNVEYNLGYRAHYSEHGHHLSYSNGANKKGVKHTNNNRTANDTSGRDMQAHKHACICEDRAYILNNGNTKEQR